jgi:hypothetical protein
VQADYDATIAPRHAGAAMYQGLFTLFLAMRCESKWPLAKAPAAAKVGRMATLAMAFLIATRREHA